MKRAHYQIGVESILLTTRKDADEHPEDIINEEGLCKGMHLAKSPQSGCLLLFLFDPESDIMLLNFSHHNHFPAVKIITSVQNF
ncbi:hypothetical protein KIL84_021044, partial [Mauremys mutica]